MHFSEYAAFCCWTNRIRLQQVGALRKHWQKGLWLPWGAYSKSPPGYSRDTSPTHTTTTPPQTRNSQPPAEHRPRCVMYWVTLRIFYCFVFFACGSAFWHFCRLIKELIDWFTTFLLKTRLRSWITYLNTAENAQCVNDEIGTAGWGREGTREALRGW